MKSINSHLHPAVNCAVEVAHRVDQMDSYFLGASTAVGTPDKLITVLHSEQRKTS